MNNQSECKSADSSDCFSNDDLPTIPEFYYGKNILVTGGTGFLGKVLIEKLLRSCPELNKIYMLMRSKREKTINDRIDDMLMLPLFKVVRDQYASLEALRSKIIGIECDMDQLQLGLTTESVDELKKVSIIYHVAATVRFDEPLRNAILMNTRLTREMVKLAKQLDNLEIYIYVSTTYCNLQHDPLEEKLYEAIMDWRSAIKVAEQGEEELLSILSVKCINPFPNTYTFSKNLSEHVINDERGDLPFVIVRPSIVTSTVNEPIAGWVDNMNGPFTFLFAAGSGIIRSLCIHLDVCVNYVAVHDVIKSMIIVSWKHGATNISRNRQQNSLPIYNIASPIYKHPSSRNIVQYFYNSLPFAPFDEIVGYSTNFVSECKYKYYLKYYCLQLTQAFLMDFANSALSKKPKFVKLQRKIIKVIESITFFMNNTWDFKTTKNIQLFDNLKASDKEHFDNNMLARTDYQDYVMCATLGFRRFVSNQKDEDLPKARKNFKRIRLIHITGKSLFFICVLYFICQYLYTYLYKFLN